MHATRIRRIEKRMRPALADAEMTVAPYLRDGLRVGWRSIAGFGDGCVFGDEQLRGRNVKYDTSAAGLLEANFGTAHEFSILQDELAGGMAGLSPNARVVVALTAHEMGYIDLRKLMQAGSRR